MTGFGLKKFPVELDEYQVANLEWALKEIMKQDKYNDLNTGDWVGELVYLLEELDCDYPPNY